MVCIYKHKTMDDRYHANDFPAVDGAKDFLLGYEMFQTVLLVRESLFGSLLVLVGPHDIPRLVFLSCSFAIPFLPCIFERKVYL